MELFGVIMSKLKLFNVTLLITFFVSCSMADLSSPGSRVEVVNKVPKDMNCKNLGVVFGKGGGSFGGTWVSDENLMEYSYNDLRNNAANKGATHVIVQGHQMGMSTGKYGGSTSTSTVSGIAYHCTAK